MADERHLAIHHLRYKPRFLADLVLLHRPEALDDVQRIARFALNLRLPESRRTAALEKIARDKLSVREADRLVDAMLAAPKDTPGPCRSTVPMVGDVRLFVNTLQHAVDLMTQRGIPAVTSCEQADGFLEYTVRIPTATPAPLPVPNTLPACHEPEMPSGEGSSLGEEDELVRS